MKATKPINDSVKNQLKQAAEYVSEMFAELSALRAENDELREKLGMEGRDFKPTEFEGMTVTNVQVYPFKKDCGFSTQQHILGLASVVLNDQLLVRSLRIMDGPNGLYVAYPVDPFFKGEESRSVCLPMARDLREHIENCVLEKYKAITA